MSEMEKKKILLYQGGRYFFRKRTYKYFRSILNDYKVDHYDEVDVFSDRDFFRYDTAIFFSQWGELTEKQEKNILEFVGSGKGLVGLHGASASFKAHPKYFEMLGGRFIGHKSKTEIDITIKDKNHPITKGLDDFQFYDEPYRHDFSMAKDLHVLAEGDYHDPEDPEPEPMIWTHQYGKGKVVFCALGHKASSLKKPIFRTIIKRAVRWVLEE